MPAGCKWNSPVANIALRLVLAAAVLATDHAELGCLGLCSIFSTAAWGADALQRWTALTSLTELKWGVLSDNAVTLVDTVS